MTIARLSGGMLGDPAANDLGRFDAGLIAAMVPVGVEEADLAAAVGLVAQPRPGGDSRQRAVPAFAAGYLGRLAEPERAGVDQLEARRS